MKIAFIGLGRMGSGMALNLLRAGHQVTVYNRSASKAEELARQGAQMAASPARAAEDCEAALSMLADDPALESVTFGADGLSQGLPPGAAHISHSTISLAMARRLSAAHAGLGQTYLSAPVFGRPEAAVAKKLIVVVAGQSAAVERYRPLYDAIGRFTVVAGLEPWHANAIKLLGNFMLGSMLETFGEAFATMRKAAIDPQLFLDVMNELFQSPVYKNYGTLAVTQKFEPANFALPLALKDVRLALEASRELNAPMPFASVLQDQLLSAMAHGQQSLDWSSLTLVAARSAGLPEPRR
jgi:3-hydroxyisobutyrate dehydrogenase-like beta-hydroxyacid dehydrogenase